MKNNFINPHLFKLEQKRGFVAFLWFSIITAVLVFVVCAVYPATKDLLANNSMLAELGISMNSMADYLNSELLQMWLVPVTLYVCCAVVSTTTNELRNGSFELIYTLNMGRKEIIRTKVAKISLDVLIINIVGFAASTIGALAFGKGGVNIANLLVYLLFAVVVSLEIMLFMFAITLLGKRSVGTFSGVVVALLMYLMCSLMNVGGDKTQWLGFLTPLATLNGSILTSGFSGLFENGVVLGVWAAISVVLYVLALNKFKNDDII